MWKLKIKPAFTLVEVMCSVSIFSLLFLTALTIELNAIRLKKHNNQLYEHCILMETVKSNVMGNVSYNELRNLHINNKIYINKEFLTSDKLKAYRIIEIASDDLTSNEIYVKLNITDGIVVKVDIELYGKFNNKEKLISTTIYKGNY